MTNWKYSFPLHMATALTVFSATCINPTGKSQFFYLFVESSKLIGLSGFMRLSLKACPMSKATLFFVIDCATATNDLNITLT